MKLLACTLMATACMALAACEKHQEPIGTVPAEDVPAVPAPGAAGQGTDADASACAREIGAEREACLRRYPPAGVTPAEPEKSPPPQPAN